MDPVPLSLTLIAAGFLLGSIPFGWLAAKLAGTDIRKLGSGNIGATNVWRTLGWKWGLPVLLLDALKGWGPVFVATAFMNSYADTYPGPKPYWFMGRVGGDEHLGYLPFLVGIAAILGHTFTPWLRFKGGKGVATGLGVAAALYGVWILIPLAVFVLALLATRMVSVGSICAAIALAALSLLALLSQHFAPHLAHLVYLWPFGLLGALLVIWTHRANIRRILNGTENKVSFDRLRRGGAARR